MSGYPSEWDEALAEAERDEREGDHVAIVTEVISTSWKSGDPCVDVNLILPTAGNGKANIRFNENVPTKAEIELLKAAVSAAVGEEALSKTRGALAGAGNAIRLRTALAKHFGVINPAELKVGTRMGVEVAKTKSGFLRVINIGPVPDTSKTAQGEDIPF